MPRRSNADVPKIRLGRTRERGIAPSMLGLVEHGARRRPKAARAIRGRVVFRFEEPLDPVRINFAARAITVEDGDLGKPDLAIEGTLPDIVHLATAPHVGGVPSPVSSRGLVALGRVARRRVQLRGDRALARKLLRLLSL